MLAISTNYEDCALNRIMQPLQKLELEHEGHSQSTRFAVIELFLSYLCMTLIMRFNFGLLRGTDSQRYVISLSEGSPRTMIIIFLVLYYDVYIVRVTA